MRQFLIDHRRETINVLMTLGALGLVFLISALAPNLGRRTFHRIERSLARFAHKSWRAVALVFAASLAMNLLTLAVAGIPQPRIHDEFSYLLAADTFAHGRLANPPIPPEIQPFLETMHELMQPHYASKYFPAQGLTLALGQVLTGYPIFGAIFCAAIACALTTWALLAWVRPKRWALIIGLVLALHPLIIEWASSYWGGSVAMCGAALVFGSIPRVMQKRSIGAAILLALGLAILLNSRPYEGAVWFIAAMLTFIAWLIRRNGPTIRTFIRRVALPASIVLVPTIAWIALYNDRVTGNPYILPDTLHTDTYMAVPRFFWGRPQPPKTYHSQAMRDHYDGYERHYFETQQTPRGFVIWLLEEKIYKFIKNYLLRSLPLLAGLIAAPLAALAEKRTKLALAYAIIFIIGWLIIPWFEVHYAAAILPVIAMLAVSGMRGIGALRWRGAGRMFVRWCLVSVLLVAPMALKRAHSLYRGGAWWQKRVELESKLSHSGDKHLIIVRYGAQHQPGDEWVFNRADLNNAPVVWAREPDDIDMSILLNHFADRRAWLLDLTNEQQIPDPVPYSLPTTR
jgi:hypothetical protein